MFWQIMVAKPVSFGDFGMYSELRYCIGYGISSNLTIYV